MYWYKSINNSSTKEIIPSLGRGAVDCEMAGRGNKDPIKTPTSSFLKEGIARFPALIFTLLAALILHACKPDTIQTGTAQKYFDLKAYFKADTARLNKLHRVTTYKTVTHNGTSESKKVSIKNWGTELSLFSESDINKPAWKDSYQVQNTGSTITYRAKYPELKTRQIIINKQGDKIKGIQIQNSTANMLYQTTENLSYYPDSVYIIQKYQKVMLLGANNYKITGTLN